jgi:hypothetical protein
MLSYSIWRISQMTSTWTNYSTHIPLMYERHPYHARASQRRKVGRMMVRLNIIQRMKRPTRGFRLSWLDKQTNIYAFNNSKYTNHNLQSRRYN